MGSLSYPATMKAAQYDQRDNKVHINEIPVPTPKSNELLVKTLCSSLCRSDLMNFEPDELGLKPTAKDTPPITIGHEAAGVVVALGDECKGFSIGDEVGFLPSTNCCFECDECQIHQMWCKTLGGCKMPGHAADGFFQEYIATDYRNAIVLPSGLSAVEAAPLFCAGVTSYHGIADLGIPAGQWVAIIGCGGLGHLGMYFSSGHQTSIPLLTTCLSRNPIRQSKRLQSDRSRHQRRSTRGSQRLRCRLCLQHKDQRGLRKINKEDH